MMREGGCMVAGGMCGGWHTWKGGHALQGVCVAGGHTCHGRYYGIRSMSGRYASYWNVFLSIYVDLDVSQIGPVRGTKAIQSFFFSF